MAEHGIFEIGHDTQGSTAWFRHQLQQVSPQFGGVSTTTGVRPLTRALLILLINDRREGSRV